MIPTPALPHDKLQRTPRWCDLNALLGDPGKKATLRFLMLTITLFSACAADSPTFSRERWEHRAKITYYDRNGDGKVDLEKHEYPGYADADWELRDDDYDGRYEKKILYGFAVRESAVNIPVPTNVKISRTP